MKNLLAWVGSHRKAFVAYGTAVVTILAVVLPQSNRWYAVMIAIAGALGVHVVPNRASVPAPAASPSAPVVPPVKPPAV